MDRFAGDSSGSPRGGLTAVSVEPPGAVARRVREDVPATSRSAGRTLTGASNSLRSQRARRRRENHDPHRHPEETRSRARLSRTKFCKPTVDSCGIARLSGIHQRVAQIAEHRAAHPEGAGAGPAPLALVESDESVRVGPGYPLDQLARAFVTALATRTSRLAAPPRLASRSGRPYFAAWPPGGCESARGSPSPACRRGLRRKLFEEGSRRVSLQLADR